MRLSNLFRGLVFCLALFTVCANAADKAVAVVHVVYKGEGLYYADNEENFKFREADKQRNGTYIVELTEERLKPSAIDARRLRFGLNCTENTKDCESYLYSSDDQLPTLKELFPDYVYQEADQPVYEVWISVDANGVVVLPAMPEEYVVPDSVEKVFMLFPSWDNTSAIMSIDGKDYTMISASPYCGWFKATAKVVPKDAYVSFRQTIGNIYIGADGISRKPIAVEDEINLDSILAVGSDTVWILAKHGYPDLYSEYPPDNLKDCPVKKLPVMMFDWLHGKGSDEENATSQAGTTSQDFGTGGCKGPNSAYDARTGMVETQLGPKGVPVRAQNFPKDCELTDHLDNWFLPEEVKANGKTYTNVTCRELELVLDTAGFWLGQQDLDSPEHGMFLLDDFKYLVNGNDSIPNPYYDQLSGTAYDKNGKEIKLENHNYGFTMKVQAQFEYVPGQKFEFFGDDDVWVFINNKLVVDIGGQHHRVNGKVNLDTIGQNTGDTLVPGQTYPFHIFYAERHKVESNFKMRTSIDLRSDASMFLTDLSSDPDLIKKEVWQIVRERALACDFSSSPENETTERGPSNFVLYGKSLPRGGVELKTLDSLYYKGIKVQNGFTMLTIDLKAIEHAQSLPPGTYYVRVSLKENPDEYKDVYFTVPPYALPNLAFAIVKDSSYKVIDFETQDTTYFTQYWSPLGNEVSRNVSSDSLPINLDKNEKMWAGRSYPVNIMYAEEWATIYNDIAVKITTSTDSLVPCDSMGNPLGEVVLTQGHAHFFVKAIGEVVNGTLTISTDGSTNKSVDWTNINIAVPPVPQVEVAYIYDRTGDGRADSIWIHFNKPLGGQSVLDYLKFTFGAAYDTQYLMNGDTAATSYVAKYNDGDSVAVLYTKNGGGFGTSIYTGGSTKPYTGKLNLWYTYTDDAGKTTIFPIEGPLTDRVGPVIVAAEISYLTDGNTVLKLAFSEGLFGENANTELFRFHCWNADILDSNVKQASDIGTTPANEWKLVFPRGSDTDVVPAVGDSVRLTPPSQLGEALDLLAVGPHENNPFVRITGEQKITVSSPTVVTIDPGSPAFEEAREIIKSKNATVPKFIDSEKPLTVDQVAEKYGTQGHYLSDLDMGTLVENEIAEIVKAIQSNPSYVDQSAKGDVGTVQSYTIEEIIAMVSRGELSIDKAKKRFGLDEAIVNAYKNGLLTQQNVHNYSNGSESQIQAIVDSMANHTELHYKTIYYTSLGQFVNEDSGTIRCNDPMFSDTDSKTCRGSKGRFYLAWNMRSSENRLAATGVYIARLVLRIKVNSKIITDSTRDFLWGVRHGRLNVFDIDY